MPSPSSQVGDKNLEFFSVCLVSAFFFFFFFFHFQDFLTYLSFISQQLNLKKKKKNNRPVEIHIFSYLFLILNYHNTQAHKERAGDKGIMEIQELK